MLFRRRKRQTLAPDEAQAWFARQRGLNAGAVEDILDPSGRVIPILFGIDATHNQLYVLLPGINDPMEVPLDGMCTEMEVTPPQGLPIKIGIHTEVVYQPTVVLPEDD